MKIHVKYRFEKRLKMREDLPNQCILFLLVLWPPQYWFSPPVIHPKKQATLSLVLEQWKGLHDCEINVSIKILPFHDGSLVILEGVFKGFLLISL